MSRVSQYSSEKITKGDLARLAKLTLEDLGDFFSRRPEMGDLYRNRLLALCLCQGAADHYVNGEHGVKDFDVWAFFRCASASAVPSASHWARRLGAV
jgi:hypothetical protein